MFADRIVGQPEKTAESFSADGWFKTGDLGYLTLCGRSKDLIISGGLNIYPPEVERVLVEHPAVNACAVIGCLDKEWGEKVTAVVVLNKGESVTSDALIRFCRERLAPYKSPKSLSSGMTCLAMQWGRFKRQNCEKRYVKLTMARWFYGIHYLVYFYWKVSFVAANQ